MAFYSLQNVIFGTKVRFQLLITIRDLRYWISASDNSLSQIYFQIHQWRETGYHSLKYISIIVTTY